MPLRALLLVAVVLHVGVTSMTPNPWHPDEHFQVLEFAWARAGLAPLDALPWEFEARIRPALQPTLALGVLLGLRAVGLTDAGTWILVLRLGTLVLALGVGVAVALRVGPTLARPGRRVLWLTTLFLWFAPLFTGRFSSENLSGLALAAALVVATGRRDEGGRAPSVTLVGLLLGLGLVFRLQLVFAAAPLLAWMAWRPDRPGEGGDGREALLAVGTAAAVLGASLLVDSWFYGAWTVTPWRYVQVNLLEGVAASFGTSPWWWYGAFVPLWLAPPVGVAVAVLAVTGALVRPRSPWGWCFAGFLLGHVAVAHKELRFLLPLLYLVPPLVAAGWDVLAARARRRRWLRALAFVLVAQNVVLAAFLLTPSIHRGREFDTHYYRFLEARAEEADGPLYLLSPDGRPWAFGILDPRVYHEDDVIGVSHGPDDPLPDRLRGAAARGRVLLLTRRAEPPEVGGARLEGPLYRAEAGYRTVARWLGMDHHPFLARLERLEGWEGSGWVRRVWEVRPAPATPGATP